VENINNEMKVLEEKATELSDKMEELTKLIHKLVSGLDQSDEVVNSINENLEEIESSIALITKENEEKVKVLMAQTVTLMQEGDLNDKYKECEANMKTSKRIEKMLNSSKEMIERQKMLLEMMWQQQTN
jgi:chromosome segregation ATPase